MGQIKFVFSNFIIEMTHKSDDYKISAVKYYLIIKIILEKPVKFLIVRNLHYKDGYIDIKPLKILQEETENLYLTKLQNHKLKVR